MTELNALAKEFAKEIPEEIKYVVKALDEDIRVAIIVALMKQSRMTFSEIKKSFELNSSSLSYHLSILQEGGLIRNLIEKNDDGSYSYYTTTDITEPILSALHENIVQIPKSILSAENIPADDKFSLEETRFKEGEYTPITPRTRRSVKVTYSKETSLRYPSGQNSAYGA